MDSSSFRDHLLANMTGNLFFLFIHPLSFHLNISRGKIFLLLRKYYVKEYFLVYLSNL